MQQVYLNYNNAKIVSNMEYIVISCRALLILPRVNIEHVVKREQVQRQNKIKTVAYQNTKYTALGCQLLVLLQSYNVIAN